MTADIIQSQISIKQMTTDEIKAAFNDTFQALKTLQDAEAGTVETGLEEETAQHLLLTTKNQFRKIRSFVLNAVKNSRCSHKYISHFTVLIQNHTAINTVSPLCNRSVQSFFLKNGLHLVKNVVYLRISQKLLPHVLKTIGQQENGLTKSILRNVQIVYVFQISQC